MPPFLYFQRELFVLIMEQYQKKHLGQVIGLAGALVLAFCMQLYFRKPLSIDKLLVQTVSEINKSLPIQVDADTRLDNAGVLPGKAICYNYTLIKRTKDEVPVEQLQQVLSPKFINVIKTSPDLKLFREKGVTFSYNYWDKNAVFLFKIVITPEMYKD